MDATISLHAVSEESEVKWCFCMRQKLCGFKHATTFLQIRLYFCSEISVNR
jgi:hypothetical protein